MKFRDDDDRPQVRTAAQILAESFEKDVREAWLELLGKFRLSEWPKVCAIVKNEIRRHK